MHIYKIEMSFENSNNSIPVMSEETSEIWNFISKSCSLTSISQSFTGRVDNWIYFKRYRDSYPVMANF